MGMGFDQARHLLYRAGFGGRYDDIRDLEALAHEDAVDKLLADVRTDTVSTAPEWIDEEPPGPIARALNPRGVQKKIRDMGMQLKTWWLQEMIVTDSPLTERMTLFWHNHFTSSLRKVRWAPALYRQNQMLRTHALGSFRDLLHAVLEDPAMLVYLDNIQNQKKSPNENLARELLELFTLGEGHYSETDIKEAARALTGYGVHRPSATFRFVKRQHDNDDKTFLGKTGNHDASDLVDILLAQDRTAEFIATKLWYAFVSRTADRDDSKPIQAVADAFRSSDYDISAALRTVLLSEPFRANEERGAIIKSPVDLVVGTLRAFDALNEADSDDDDDMVMMNDEMGDKLVKFCRRLGQDLLDPPNVKGWPGGRRWITTTTLLVRQRGMRRVTRAKGLKRVIKKQGIGALLGLPTLEAPDSRQIAIDTLLGREPVLPLPDDSEGNLMVLHAMLNDPAYQMR